MIKICIESKFESDFKKDIQLHQYFKDKLPVPQIHYYDLTKKNYPYMFFIYPKIQGKSLSRFWHKLSWSARFSIISEIIFSLKMINQSDLSTLVPKPILNWKKRSQNELFDAYTILKDQNLLPE